MADPYDELLQVDRGPLDELHDEQLGFEPAIETDVYYYHPDHLGNTGYVTQVFGEVSQHVEYFAFGETFLEEHNNDTDRTPYLFNAKELDEETGLYYYGARYYDPVVSNWLSVDPIYEDYLDNLNLNRGGIYRSMNLNNYNFVSQNPINIIDFNGLCEGDDCGTDVFFNADKTVSSQENQNNKDRRSPNRWFVEDKDANEDTENRYERDGKYYEMVMIPSSEYSDSDGDYSGINSRFDTDRAAYVGKDGKKYNDKNAFERTWDSLKDNPTLVDYLAIITRGKSKGGPIPSGVHKGKKQSTGSWKRLKSKHQIRSGEKINQRKKNLDRGDKNRKYSAKSNPNIKGNKN